jgi:hypothetical protein
VKLQRSTITCRVTEKVQLRSVSVSKICSLSVLEKNGLKPDGHLVIGWNILNVA